MIGSSSRVAEKSVRQQHRVDTPEQIQLFGDARTLLIALVVIAYQIGVTQAAAILERRALYFALDRIGMPRRTMRATRMRATRMRATRMRQVLAPALVAVLGSAAVSALLASTLLVVALTSTPLFFFAAILALSGEVVLIGVGVDVTTPVVRRLLDGAARTE
ncbi:hypothetical protein [Agromyces mediolanus]|uniref:hypothetical protein n=1 Tax=Agromyces mediolanus TaxID=41986 RepID=UPI001E4A8036|nr:hypothetical protein [Agromyces mediolanus]MCD1569899.1 hypothetical protein [Agromyces mediolanus]